MNTVYIHIDENLDADRLHELKSVMRSLPHVSNVEINAAMPHDMLVEFEEHHNTPMAIISRLSRYGLHSDITAC